MNCIKFLKPGLAAFFLLATVPAFSQLEVAGGGGLASFHEQNADTQNKGTFVASVSGNFGHIVSAGFEYGFIPLASANLSSGTTSASGTEHLNTFGGVVRVGISPSHAIQPFVAIVGGGLRDTVSVNYTTGGGSSGSQSDSENGGYFGGGGGVNLAVGGGFGVRPEVRYEHLSLSGGGHTNELAVLGELYFRFGSTHLSRHK
ncbi:MAG: outer membrane beta-barrel protein [Acidobacteriota bacterium]